MPTGIYARGPMSEKTKQKLREAHTLFSLADLQYLALSRGGKCLSDKYTNIHDKYLWQCCNGHIWPASWGSIKDRESWCPTCCEYRGEKICRLYLERFFNQKFPKRRPNWLIGSKGRPLELDGFCKELNIAFEYNGGQHFFPIKRFNSNRSFKEIQEIDSIKRNLCKQNNTQLIEVTYKTPNEQIGECLLESCKNLNLTVVNSNTELDFEECKLYGTDHLNTLKELAKSRGGACLSVVYLGAHTPLKWQCKEGHTWDAAPNEIKHGTWCATCNHVKELTIEDMYLLAEEREGKCLSTVYVNSGTKLKWLCKNGHDWNATPENIKYNHSWCPHCSYLARRGPNPKLQGRAAPNKSNIDEMRKLAESNEGGCLSDKYVDMHFKLEWQCKNGHVWLTSPTCVKQGHWCPYCRHAQGWLKRKVQRQSQH